ncbi:MAG: hypothetical protein QOF63_1180 [Thermoanaerobaculia bacterium]|jgi:hypothetical protein|nr:hypothetical protein [Thermoanaerobaculia bacterium]
MKLFDPQWFSDRVSMAEERANRMFERSAVVNDDGFSTYIRCGPPRFASVFVVATVLSVFLSVLGLMGPRWLFFAVLAVIGLTAILSARESVTVTISEVVVCAGLRPFRKTVKIPSSSVQSVRVEAFRDTPWDPYVAIVTTSGTFRIATSISENAAQEVAQAIRKRLSGRPDG